MPRNHIRKESVNVCVVCCEEIAFYAIGQCDHPVCYVCSVRMRVLGKEKYCAVCRSDIETVILTKTYSKWSSLQDELSNGYVDKKLGLCYTTKEVRNKVKDLLQHKCKLCPDRPPYGQFEQLRDHIKKEHHLMFCMICLQHHRKFSHEWKLYNRTELATHRRVGDADDKSHKGHPLCKFCEDRFLDDDELHRHLRKNHFWCHICESDGKQLYFMDYPNLKNHFRDEHFLCEEDMCKYEQFTCVFRTEIDLQAHRASKHTQKMTKAQVRQARQLEVDLVYSQRQSNQGRTITGQDFHEVRSNDQRSKRPRGKASNYNNRQDEANVQTAINNSLATNNRSRTPSPPVSNVETTQENAPQMLEFNHSDFPSLNGNLENLQIQPTMATPLPGRNLNSLDDFPSLGNISHPPGPPHPGFGNILKETNKTNPKNPPPGFKKKSPPIQKKSESTKPSIQQQTSTDSTSTQKPVSKTLSAEIPTSKKNVQTVNKPNVSRNQAFIENVKLLLGNDIDKFKLFKTLSGDFRQGHCSAEEYYTNCTELFGNNFSRIFNELVNLLPDLDKQTQLLAVHNDSKVLAKQNGKKVVQSVKPPTQIAWGPIPAKQAKPAKPVKQDSKTRQEMDFPSLPTAGPRQMKAINVYRPTNSQPMKSAWVRGK